MATQIRLAITQADREAVYRLRYDVYVEELRRTQLYVDHDRQWIKEPLDDDGAVFAAFDGARAIGTVRCNYARNGSLSEYVRLYEMERMGERCPALSSVTTKLLVRREYRNSTLGFRLAAAGYETLLNEGLEYDFIDVYPARLSFFERLGYVVHAPRAVHEEYGEVIVMRLDLRDAVHLRKTGSPLLRYLQRSRQAA